MPRRGDGITKRKGGRFMARVTVQTPDGPRRKYIYGKKYGEVKKKRDLALGDRTWPCGSACGGNLLGGPRTA